MPAGLSNSPPIQRIAIARTATGRVKEMLWRLQGEGSFWVTIWR